jgi:hypothetical protein
MRLARRERATVIHTNGMKAHRSAAGKPSRRVPCCGTCAIFRRPDGSAVSCAKRYGGFRRS